MDVEKYAIMYRDYELRRYSNLSDATTALLQYSRWFIGLRIKLVIEEEGA